MHRYIMHCAQVFYPLILMHVKFLLSDVNPAYYKRAGVLIAFPLQQVIKAFIIIKCFYRTKENSHQL